MLTLYRLVKIVFVLLAIALLWAIAHPESGIAPSSPPSPTDTPSTWFHIDRVTYQSPLPWEAR